LRQSPSVSVRGRRRTSPGLDHPPHRPRGGGKDSEMGPARPGTLY
jgi:hypothetical protein